MRSPDHPLLSRGLVLRTVSRRDLPHGSTCQSNVPPASLDSSNVILRGHFDREGVHRVKLDTKSRTAKRMQGVRGEAAFEMLGRANELERQGRSIIHLEIGEPDFDTPEPIIQAGI